MGGSINAGSVWRGVRAMSWPNNAKWGVQWLPKSFWCNAWTPIWHDGSGPYLSLGLWFIAIYRGY